MGWEDSVSCLAKYSEAVSERRNQENWGIKINTESETIGLNCFSFIRSNIDKNKNRNIISKKISFEISEIEESTANERLNV